MPEKYKKLCMKCANEFESDGNRNCPHCGSDYWIFIDEEGRQIHAVGREIARRRQGVKDIIKNIRARNPEGKGMSEARAQEILEQTYPMP